MSTNELNETPAPKSRKTGRRVAVVGTIAGLALIGGAGAAYAASQQAPVESGYATVVDEATPGGANGATKGDCPDRGDGSGGSDGSGGTGRSGESGAPSTPSEPSTPTTPDQPTTPEQSPGDI